MGQKSNLSIQVPESAVSVFNGVDGTNGQNAYVYIASADDASGTNFNYPQNIAQEYTATLSTYLYISNPQASDFSGLWRKTLAIDGAPGSNGTNGVSSGFEYKFSQDTNPTDPTSGYLKFGVSGSPVDAFFVSKTDNNGNDLSGILTSLGFSTSTNKSLVTITGKLIPTNYISFQVSIATDDTTYIDTDTLNISASNLPPFTDQDVVILTVIPVGDKGDTGNNGVDSILNTTSTSTLTVALGTQSFTTSTPLSTGLGSYILLADSSNPITNYMIGVITSISGTTATITVLQGSGFGGGSSTWDISIVPGLPSILSTTSNTILTYGTGTQSLTTDTVLTADLGSNIILTDPANPSTNYMLGKLTSISGTSISIDITFDSTGGAGNNNPWNIQVQGEPGKETNTGFQEITLVLPTASILTGFTVPVQFIPAQGTGTAIQIIEGTARLNFNSTGYTSVHNFSIYGATSGVVYATINSGILSAVADSIFNFTLPLLASSAASLGLNEALNIKVLTGDPATGDSDITFNCTYKVSSI